jgi:hypothetical protein
MPNFYGNNELVLQPNDDNISYRFDFDACSSVSLNDGYLPYGTTISGVTVLTYDEDNNVVTDLVQDSSVSNNTVTVVLSYPATSGAGSYKITFILSVSDGSTIEADFHKVNAKNL